MDKKLEQELDRFEHQERLRLRHRLYIPSNEHALLLPPALFHWQLEV